jgi:hypothetical protein
MTLRERIAVLRDQYAAMRRDLNPYKGSEADIVLDLVVQELTLALAATAQSNHNDVVRAATLED